jgi:hypothetical protein
MVKIIRDPEVVRMEHYNNINQIMLSDFYLRPAGTAASIHPRNNRFRIGELFLSWDNKEVSIRGYPEMFWEVAQRIEAHGYSVTIKSPHKIERYIVTPEREVYTNKYEVERREQCLLETPLKTSLLSKVVRALRG